MTAPPPTGHRRRATLLIVDDTPTNIQILANSLRAQYDILIATSGAAALERLRGPKLPDLILLDVMMPEMDGYEVCRRIKEDPATQSIPIIFVTANSQLEDQKRGFSLGAVDYITKPFELPLLHARVQVHVRLKLLSEQLEQLAMRDALTDIPNRRALDDTLRRECLRAERDGLPLAALMIDVDFFKAYNDHYGHGAGDECLRSVARTLEDGLLRPGDFIGRYGGEEFMAILPDCDADGARTVAEKLRERVFDLELAHAHSRVADRVSVSIGVAAKAAGRPMSPAELQREADQALYTAKNRGRNQVASASC